MLRIIIAGSSGYMGKVLADIAAKDPDVEVAAGFDIVSAEAPCSFPVFSDPRDFTGSADVVVDFSVADALDGILSFGTSRNIPLVLCATGYSPKQLEAIEKAAERVPVFRSANMSLGINLLVDLIKRACSVLGESYDVEIVERHHRRKLDAPSGTALMLADAAASSLPYESEYVFERKSKRQQRHMREIGISAVRGGTIVGEHEVIFAGLDEVVELKHTAASRDVFAVGAIRAAKFITKTAKPGLYNMENVFNEFINQN